MAALMDSGDATMAITSHVVSSVTRTLTLDDAGVVALMEIVPQFPGCFILKSGRFSFVLRYGEQKDGRRIAVALRIFS